MMEVNRIIAKKGLEIFGGIPKVNRFWNNSNTKKIDILKCEDVPQDGIQSCATIGLNNIDIGMSNSNSPLRVEILGASDMKNVKFENIIASVALDIMEQGCCFPGHIIPNIIEQYIDDSEMKHVLLTDPFLWEGAKSFLLDDVYIAWLMVVPISEKEYVYASENGVDELGKVFEENEIDIYNIWRKSVI